MLVAGSAGHAMLNVIEVGRNRRSKSGPMQKVTSKASATWYLLAYGLCWLGSAAWADVRISKLEVDGRPLELSANTASNASPLRISSAARSVIFHFTEGVRHGPPTMRLRYKLEGYDNTWRDPYSQDVPIMKLTVAFRDRNREVVGSDTVELTGETSGWEDTAGNSDFVTKRFQSTAPARSATARIMLLSGGAPEVMGLMAVDALRVLVTSPQNGQKMEYHLNVTEGTDLDRPLGSPANWMREGSRADMAILQTRSIPKPHPMLVLRDEDPRRYAIWSQRNEQSLPVQPGDRFTLEWQTAYSIGRSGPGAAVYPRLAPGRYFFRVAAVKINGEPTGMEASLPLVVVPPVYYRAEFWLIITALLGLGGGWISRVVIRRRMQRKLAEHERQHALERERGRIARDLHDHIGAGLTEIAMQSDWAHSDLEQNLTVDAQQRIARIRQSATELARNIDEIVWVMNPANDTLKNFTNYLTQYTAQFLEAANLSVRFDIPRDVPDVSLAGKVRHHLFLAVREALNNTAKHARADLVRIGIRMEPAGLHITVEDNGIGFTPEQARAAGAHEGLESMRRRMEEIGGQFQLTSRPGGGTRIELCTPS